MSGLHFTLGLAVVVSYALLTIVNLLRMTRGGTFAWARGLSFAAAGLLLLQYVIGFALLGRDASITPLHYILALVAIVPVGAEHMMNASDRPAQQRHRIAFVASLVTLLLVAFVYHLGEQHTR